MHIEDDPYYTGPREGAVFSNSHTGYMGKKAYKICVECELEKRLKYVNTKEYREGHLVDALALEGNVPKEEMLAEGGYATMTGVMKDLKKGSKRS